MCQKIIYKESKSFISSSFPYVSFIRSVKQELILINLSNFDIDKIFKKGTRSSFDHSFVIGLLGICYEKENDACGLWFYFMNGMYGTCNVGVIFSQLQVRCMTTSTHGIMICFSLFNKLCLGNKRQSWVGEMLRIRYTEALSN